MDPRTESGGRVVDWAAVWNAFAASATVGHYAPGKILVHQDVRSPAIFTIYEGLIKAIRRRPDGRDVVVSVRGPGSPLCVTPAILNIPTSETLVTLTDCVVGQVSTLHFLDALAGRRDLADALLRLQSARLREHVERFTTFTLEPARRRLEIFLTQLAREVGAALPDGAVRFTLPLAQLEFASAINVTPETLSRVMGELEREGVIKRKYHRVTLLRPHLLQANRLDQSVDPS